MKDDSNNNVDDDIGNTAIIMDADLLVLLEKAKSGDIDALIDLGHAFNDGKRAGKNYTLAKKYLEQLLDTLDDEYELAKYYTLWNLAVLEADYGNYENLKQRFYQIIDFMVNHIPMEEWKFDVFGWIEECVDWKNEQENEED